MTTTDIPHEGSEEYEQAMELACEYFWDNIQALDHYQEEDGDGKIIEIRNHCIEDYDIKLHPVLKPWNDYELEVWKEEGRFKYTFKT